MVQLSVAAEMGLPLRAGATYLKVSRLLKRVCRSPRSGCWDAFAAMSPSPKLLDPRQHWPLFYSPRPDHKEVKLTDGGALSNSGMWSLFRLLVNQHQELEHRGVLLIVVEASKMPSYEGFASTFNSLLGTLADQGGIGRNLHERMLDILESAYGDRLATVQLDLIPRESYNVLTTWALDKRSLALLERSFELRWHEERPGLQKKARYLLAGEPLDVPLVDRARPTPGLDATAVQERAATAP